MNKKAHSNYLKLFLVFLVIFSLIGSVIGANYTIKGGLMKDKNGNLVTYQDKIVNGEAYAQITLKNGDKITLVRTKYINENGIEFTSISELNADGSITPSVYEEYGSNGNDFLYNSLLDDKQQNIVSIIEMKPDGSKGQELTLSTLQNMGATQTLATIIPTGAENTRLNQLASTSVKIEESKIEELPVISFSQCNLEKNTCNVINEDTGDRKEIDIYKIVALVETYKLFGREKNLILVYDSTQLLETTLAKFEENDPIVIARVASLLEKDRTYTSDELTQSFLPPEIMEMGASNTGITLGDFTIQKDKTFTITNIDGVKYYKNINGQVKSCTDNTYNNCNQVVSGELSGMIDISSDSNGPRPITVNIPSSTTPKIDTKTSTLSNSVKNEQELWDKSQTENTIESYRAYLEKYPEGTFIPLAKTRITKLGGKESISEEEKTEANAFLNAERKNTENSYWEFLDKYPNGKFSRIAEIRILKFPVTTITDQKLIIIEKDGKYYLQRTGYKNDFEIDLVTALAYSKGDIDSTALQSKIAEIKNNPFAFNKDEVQAAIDANYVSHSEIITQLTTKQDEISKEQDSKKKADLQKQYDNLYNGIVKDMSATEILSLPQEQRDQAIKAMNDKQCNGIMGTIGCTLGSKITIEKKAMDVFKDIQSDIKKICDNDKTKCDTTEEYNKLLSDKLSEIKIKINSKCSSDVEVNSNCLKENEEIEKLLTQNIKKISQVETNIGYDILTAILSPDQNAMSAAKLFGVEADYSNVPKFLSESIPSQICLAKIDGYLDKTKESSINGQGGLTSYGCSQEYTQVYDEETKKYKKMPQTQCLEVLADLRAQRTQVTPDGKTAISYSYYIKAPPSTELKYIVAISYVEGSTIKKQTIVPLTKTSGIKNGFDSVELFLNASDGEINENSFTINLLAIYENNEVYQKLSYSIPPITTGDTYSTPIPAQIANSNGANNDAGSSQNVKAELSTEDMLAMI